MENWSNVIQICLPIIVGLIGWGVKFLGNMAKSISEINQNIRVLVTRVDNHEKRLDNHEERIMDFEVKETTWAVKPN